MSEVAQEDKESITFPDNQNENVIITCHELTTDFLIYGTDMGDIIYFHIEEWAKAVEYRYSVGITHIFADPAGTRLVFIDTKSKGHVFNGVRNIMLHIILC